LLHCGTFGNDRGTKRGCGPWNLESMES
jgi:hypothetical protein